LDEEQDFSFQMRDLHSLTLLLLSSIAAATGQHWEKTIDSEAPLAKRRLIRSFVWRILLGGERTGLLSDEFSIPSEVKL
jgi:hypothetical protein